MKTADKMFEELGYEIERGKTYVIYWKIAKRQSLNFYQYQNETQIEFNYTYKTIEKRELFKTKADIISMQELQAINEKCKELGWI